MYERETSGALMVCYQTLGGVSPLVQAILGVSEGAHKQRGSKAYPKALRSVCGKTGNCPFFLWLNQQLILKVRKGPMQQ